MAAAEARRGLQIVLTQAMGGLARVHARGNLTSQRACVFIRMFHSLVLHGIASCAALANTPAARLAAAAAFLRRSRRYTAPRRGVKRKCGMFQALHPSEAEPLAARCGMW